MLREKECECKRTDPKAFKTEKKIELIHDAVRAKLAI